jgi:hypothetical protein
LGRGAISTAGAQPGPLFRYAPARFLFFFSCFFPLLAAAMFPSVSIRKIRLAWRRGLGPARGFAGNVVTR